MCGIWCEIGDNDCQHLDAETRQCLCRRGPDYVGEWNDERCRLVATVLHMCNAVQIQPIISVDNNDSVLVFNGEIYAMQVSYSIIFSYSFIYRNTVQVTVSLSIKH